MPTPCLRLWRYGSPPRRLVACRAPTPHAGIILYITVLYNLDMPAGINLFDDMQDQLHMEVAVAQGTEACPDGQTCTVIQLKTCALWKKCGETISQFTEECGFGVCAIPDVECGDGICVAEDLGWSQVWEAPQPPLPHTTLTL